MVRIPDAVIEWLKHEVSVGRLAEAVGGLRSSATAAMS